MDAMSYRSKGSQDDALKRALMLAMPIAGAQGSGAQNVLRLASVLQTGSEGLLKLAQGTMRTAWTVAKGAGAGADFVNRNVLAPAILKVNPLAALATASPPRVKFAATGHPCDLLKPHKHGHSKAENQFKRAHAGLKSGSARCGMRRVGSQKQLLVAAVSCAADTGRQHHESQLALDADNWSLSLGLQSSML